MDSRPSYYQSPDGFYWPELHDPPDWQLLRAGWKKVIAVLNMYQNPVLTFVSKLILLDWAIVCLQEVREFSLWDIIVKSVFMLSRSLKCLHDLKV
jgi:hypothetical protein